MNGFIAALPNKNSMHLEPYRPHPRIVEKAKQQSATASITDTQLPKVAVKPEIVSSAPAVLPYLISTPLQRITSAVIVQITIVSAKTSKIPHIPC